MIRGYPEARPYLLAEMQRGNAYARGAAAFEAGQLRAAAGIGWPRCKLTGRAFAIGEADMAGRIWRPIEEESR